VPPRSKVELYAAIRRDHRAGMSSRALAAKYHVARRTVAKAIASAWPEPRKPLPPRASRLDPYKGWIDQLLRDDLKAPRKQRHTITRIYDRLCSEHDAADAGVSYDIVRAYVAVRGGEIRLEAGQGAAEVFVPQSHQPGVEAEVDFGDVAVRLRGELVVCSLFSLRLSYSGKAVHRVSISGGMEAFLEGHVHAFQVLGGVPQGKVRYDNLKAAVARVLGLSRARTETERWIAFKSHYDLETFYCQPGIKGAHEKGGVEGDIGWFRRNHLVPVPEVASVAELNEQVNQWDHDDDARRIGMRPRTVGAYFAAEQGLLKPLPTERFATSLQLGVRVDRYAQVTVRTNRYSVPARLIGRRVRVELGASELVVYDRSVQVARHERLSGKAGARLELDHYLEALVRKPGALAGATALEQARAAGSFTPLHDAWWAAACKAHGDQQGTRALIEVLLLGRRLPREQLLAGLQAALGVGALTSDAVALEARKAADHAVTTPTAAPELAAADLTQQPATQTTTVTFLTQRRLAALPPDTRPPPSVAAYDQLLRRSRLASGTGTDGGDPTRER
jgi:transposase